jgi:mRNA interferase RelE/StbE
VTLAWRIEFAEDARKELLRLDPPVALRIHAFLTERLARLDDPRSLGEALKGAKLGSFWKYRVGDVSAIAAKSIDEPGLEGAATSRANQPDLVP